MILLAKSMELDCNDKKRFSVELLFNIFQSDFENESINKLINKKIDVYEYYYSVDVH